MSVCPHQMPFDCTSCAKNKDGRNCIEFSEFPRWKAYFWATLGAVGVAVIQALEHTAAQQFQLTLSTPTPLTVLIGVALFIVLCAMIGASLALRLRHPFEHFVVAFTGPIGIYAAVDTIFNAIP